MRSWCFNWGDGDDVAAATTATAATAAVLTWRNNIRRFRSSADGSTPQQWRRLTGTRRESRFETLEPFRRTQGIGLPGRQSADIGVEVVHAADAVGADVPGAGPAQDRVATARQGKLLLAGAHVHGVGIRACRGREGFAVATGRQFDGSGFFQQGDDEDGIREGVCAVGATLEEVFAGAADGLHCIVGRVAVGRFQGRAIPVDELVFVDMLVHGFGTSFVGCNEGFRHLKPPVMRPVEQYVRKKMRLYDIGNDLHVVDPFGITIIGMGR